jgi:preprotein translocase subunit SecF
VSFDLDINFDFMGKRKIAAVLSVGLVLVSIGSLATRGLNFGLDFTGGTLIEVGYQQPADLTKIRSQLDEAGYKNYTVVTFGKDTDVLVRLQESGNPGLGDDILKLLRSDGSEVDSRRIDYVGPQVGGELRDQGGIGMLAALVVMMMYIAVRFQSKFSLGAVSALVHDVLITIGMFSLFQLNFDLTVMAAVLAVIGYSLNDTIVVSDRIRENFRKVRKGTSLDVINKSLNQTLGRTLVTSLTTLLVLVALFVVGGELIHGFATALIIGVLVGTYSSIYVAANILMLMNISKEDLMVPEREDGVAFDDGMP